jgi:hypothetical protein
MDEQKQMEDRWRELDELLGLAPGVAPAPPAEKRPDPPPVPQAAEAPRPIAEHQTRMEEEHPRIEQDLPSESAPGWEAEFDEDGDTEIMEELPELATGDAEGTDAEGEPEATPPPGEEGDQPRRGRRRRRRGRGRGRGDKDEGAPSGGEPPTPAAEGGAPPARPGRDSQPDPRDRPNRGRRGNHQGEEPRGRPRTPVHVRQEPDPIESEGFTDEPVRSRAPLAEDDTDFSNWTVPAWQDLIASLYRPDR